MSKPVFRVRKSEDGPFYFNIVAANREVVCTSEMYSTKAMCLKGIAVIKKIAGKAKIVEE